VCVCVYIYIYIYICIYRQIRAKYSRDILHYNMGYLRVIMISQRETRRRNVSRSFPFVVWVEPAPARHMRHKFAKLSHRATLNSTLCRSHVALCIKRRTRLLVLSHYQSTDCRCRRSRRGWKRSIGEAVTYRPRARYHFSNAPELFFHDVDWWRRRVRIKDSTGLRHAMKGKI